MADGDDVALTTREDATIYQGYLPNRIDAVADWNGAANTAHLREIGLNPAIALKDGEYIPSVGEMYLIHTHRREINAALRHVGGMEIADDWHLTSTPYNATNAWLIDIRNGRITRWSAMTDVCCKMRPVSAFNFNR